jgi:hypothetical protein
MSRRRRDSALYGDAPPGVSRQIWAAYGPRYPGSARRWLDQQAEREWLASPRPVAKGTRTCETCGQPYGSKEHHGVRFCSMDCYRARVRPAPSVPTHREAVLEMTSAYADAEQRHREEVARRLWDRVHRAA